MFFVFGAPDDPEKDDMRLFRFDSQSEDGERESFSKLILVMMNILSIFNTIALYFQIICYVSVNSVHLKDPKFP